MSFLESIIVIKELLLCILDLTIKFFRIFANIGLKTLQDDIEK